MKRPATALFSTVYATLFGGCVNDPQGPKDEARELQSDHEVSIAAFAFGHFNQDAYLDLAMGDANYHVNCALSALGEGAVQVMYGDASGEYIPDEDGANIDEVWHRDISGIDETPTCGDKFGADVAAGDINGDGYDDLVVGVPGKDIGGNSDVGQLHIIYGSSGGLTSSGDQVFDQDTANIEGANEASQNFGLAVASADFNCDGKDDVAVGAPDKTVNGSSDAGTVNVIYGTSGGLSATGDQIWHQDSSGISGATEPSDRFGASLRAGNFDGNTSGGHACDDLAIGVPDEDIGAVNGAGAVAVLYGGSSGGLSSTGNDLWYQDVGSIEDSSEADERFGATLNVKNSNMDSYDDLLIWVPGEAPSGGNSGAIATIFGSSSGLVDTSDALDLTIYVPAIEAVGCCADPEGGPPCHVCPNDSCPAGEIVIRCLNSEPCLAPDGSILCSDNC